MHVLRILLLVMTAGVLAFILYQAITRANIKKTLSGFTVVAVLPAAFSLNLILTSGSRNPGEPYSKLFQG